MGADGAPGELAIRERVGETGCAAGGCLGIYAVTGKEKKDP